MVSTPELKKYVDKNLKVTLNSSRVVRGRLAGYDLFLNLNLSDAVELITNKQSTNEVKVGSCIIRGNSVISIEPVE
ncbi:hypothetical protein KL933_003395 [Ogataea haglerorum]|uniref:Sm protein G n=1 Tax=Ogataea haglerorum TaxID=1937702 RepID=A0AAN6HZT5_9ASCO|nr:hypothetical protein KL951_001815 [Ogataea haglerorum]KAG7707956.1 hypothetical protein KL950_002582 [Ogataea haglerorum]KAG7717246.1 hypothetical protein KL913_002997 [Ogataea haglerorum]KAG7719366.1 hypothetical protein KL949_002358 [Ogataea haglerorum]KAG7726464.1 hypothetical protein KL933_003395 [Ogataea haglerorum]